MTGPSLPALSQSLLRRLRDPIPENIAANLLANIVLHSKLLNLPETMFQISAGAFLKGFVENIVQLANIAATRWAGLSRSSASQTIDLLLFSDRTASTRSFCAAWCLSQRGFQYFLKEGNRILLIGGIAGVMAWF